VQSTAVPYGITIIVAALAWLFTNAVNQMLTTPYLVYSVDNRLNDTDAALINTTLTLENITDDKSYDHVEIRVIADDPDIILNATVRPYQPAWEGDVAPSFSARSATYNFPKIQPNDKFDCYIIHKKKDSMHIVLIAQNSNILLTRSSITTALVANHLVITLGIAVILTAIVIFLLCSKTTGAARYE
jgi:hypothetical protein